MTASWPLSSLSDSVSAQWASLPVWVKWELHVLTLLMGFWLQTVCSCWSWRPHAAWDPNSLTFLTKDLLTLLRFISLLTLMLMSINADRGASVCFSQWWLTRWPIMTGCNSDTGQQEANPVIIAACCSKLLSLARLSVSGQILAAVKCCFLLFAVTSHKIQTFIPFRNAQTHTHYCRPVKIKSRPPQKCLHSTPWDPQRSVKNDVRKWCLLRLYWKTFDEEQNIPKAMPSSWLFAAQRN